MDYDWPGNVRELENVLERAVVLSRSKIITREALPAFLTESPPRTYLEIDEDNLNLKQKTLDFQKRLILTALKKSSGIQKQAAARLGLKPTTLNEMIKRLKIDVDSI